MKKEVCQSCANPLTKPEDFGTEVNGIKSSDYCCSCYVNGELYGGDDMKMDEMIDICVPYAVQNGKYKDTSEARTAMQKFFPTLKRWM